MYSALFSVLGMDSQKMCRETAPSCVFYDLNSTSSEEGCVLQANVSVSCVLC